MSPPPHTPTLKPQKQKSQSSAPSPTKPSDTGLTNRAKKNKGSNNHQENKHVEGLDSLKEITGGKGYFPTNFRPGINPSVYKNPLLSFPVSTTLSTISVILHFYALYHLSEVYEQVKDNPGAQVPDYILYSIPIFMVTIISEIAYDYIHKLGLYRRNDAISSMASGSVQTLSHKLAGTVFGFFPYYWVYENYGIRSPIFQSGPFAWWSLFIGVDFCYYWVHRTGHTMNLFWAMHGVHHCSEDYNLTSALRQSVLHGWLNWAFYIPLAFFYPPKLFLLHSQFNLLYQFWIHTQTIRKLGPLEYILNTPSQHRVHHGRNSYCIDKNYGGTLCLFDRLFGTFQEEIEEIPICYGLTHPVHTFDPVAPHSKLLGNVFASMKQIQPPLKKLLACWNGPGWIPNTYPAKEYPIPPCTRHTHHKYNAQVSPGLSRYILFQFLVVTVFYTFGLAYPTHGSHILFVSALNVYVLFSFHTVGRLLDRAPGALLLELTRLSIGTIFLWFSPILFEDDISLWRTGGLVGFAGSAWVIYQYRDELKVPWAKVELGYDDDDSQIEETKQIQQAKKQ